MSSTKKFLPHLRQLANLREGLLDAMRDGKLSARIATVRRGLQLRDRLLRDYKVDALEPRVAEVLGVAVAQRDTEAAQLALALLRRERANRKQRR